MPEKIKDHIAKGSSLALKKNIDKIIKKSNLIRNWIEKNTPRTAKTVALVNILNSVCDYLNITKLSINQHISVLALSTRSIYELNVRARTLSNGDELNKWQSEAATDNIQMLEAVLSISDSDSDPKNIAILRHEISRIERIVASHGLPKIKQPAATGNLASGVKLESEHKSMFKIYSKLIHPSSYLVNNYAQAGSIEIQEILQIKAQQYAYDSICIICDELNVPFEISKPYGSQNP